MVGEQSEMSELPIVRTVAALRTQVAAWRRNGESVALVPTMGYLHEGHLELARRAGQERRRVVASVFVNPTQFAPTEDLQTYPRDEVGDHAKLRSVGCHLMYAPTVAEMYPNGFATRIGVGGEAEGLCGAFRPQMFGGVAVVVTKLLLQVMPDVAFFGEKDYQQLLVIRRFVRDLDIPVAIEGVPVVREADGLAMSSRNSYLTPEERRRAPTLNRALVKAAQRFGQGACQSKDAVDAVLDQARQEILAAGFSKIDYVDLRDAESLAAIDHFDGRSVDGRSARLLAAAWLGKARLIDNVSVASLRG
ncbi:pantothenate synthetase [Azospirillaceae bacterium]